MTLQETIEFHDGLATDEAMLLELVLEHSEDLYKHYYAQFNCEPVLMVVSATKKATYVKIVSEKNYVRKALEYVITIPGLTAKGRNEAFEMITCNSELMRDLL